uniref:Uncharacterized protein n=1 Tax=Pithovirus LCPAC304 TaxID=2506594 RepID=A0A481Z826_9VIRU|nr:MAG: hypothetical protein LCPAC304_04000 [Pithovirus LCPAC304]
MQVEEAEEIIQEITIRQTAESEDIDPEIFIFFSEETESGRIKMGITVDYGVVTVWTRFVPSDEENEGWKHTMYADPELFKSIFGAALMTYRRNVEIGDYIIFSDYTIHFPFLP